MSKLIKKKWTEFGYRMKASYTMKLYYSSDKGKIEKSERSRKVMSDEKIRLKIRESNLNSWKDKDLKMLHSQIMKKCYSNDKALSICRKHIIQLDIFGNKIGEYKSLIEAENKTGIKFKGISKVLNGACKTYGGYIWLYFENYINGNYVINVPQRVKNIGKRILQLNLNNEIQNKYIYPNLGEFKTSHVLECCNGKRNICYGFRWAYEDEYIKSNPLPTAI